MFNRRNFLGLASVVSFVASAPAALASAIARATTIRGRVLSANRGSKTFQISGGYGRGTAGYGGGGYDGGVTVKLARRAKIKVKKDGRLRRGNFGKIVEAAENGWQAEVKGRLNGAGDEMSAKKVILIEPSYGGY